MSSVSTLDRLTPITLYGRKFPVVDDKITIPVKTGEPYVVTLVTEDLKRKDWRYEVERPGEHFTHIEFDHLLQALHLIIKEQDLL